MMSDLAKVVAGAIPTVLSIQFPMAAEEAATAIRQHVAQDLELHLSGDDSFHPNEEGWFEAACHSCDWTQGPLPDRETVGDALIEHAALTLLFDLDLLPPATPKEDE